MRYIAVAADYDGTLASLGMVADNTVRAIERLLASGRKFLVVTGRILPDLLEAFPQVALCERVVAENGALLYRPGNKAETILGERPPAKFIETLRQRGVAPLSVGQVIVATWTPHENIVLNTIRDLGLDRSAVIDDLVKRVTQALA